MKTYLPGTLLEMRTKGPDEAEMILAHIFAGGGLVLSQVSNLSGAPPHTIQNWVKRGFCSSPMAKKYSKRQFCRLLIINALKDSLSIPQIVQLLSSINGHLDDESDDLIEDDVLYLYFVRLVMSLDDQNLSEQTLSEGIRRVLEAYREPVPGGKEQLGQVLCIMVCAYFAAHLQKLAVAQLERLEQEHQRFAHVEGKRNV